MTDLEISKALALAIGWKKRDWFEGPTYILLPVRSSREGFPCSWQGFDYRDWNVIGPIAERYDVFPFKNFIGVWTARNSDRSRHCTPQKAIALAVIGVKK